MRQYLIRIVAAGILCALASARFREKDAISRLIRLMCGVFMTLTVISPWRNIKISSFLDSVDLQQDQKNAIISDGKMYSDTAFREVIKEQCRTYIVEKAKGMGVNIDADVVLNQGNPPTPCAVTITGGVPPYTKSRLEELLMQDLGIPEEQQIWQ